MYTQCPECLTIYEIDEDALQASLGIVHCGYCRKRFDALRTLSDTLPLVSLVSLPEQAPSTHAPTLTEPAPESAFGPASRLPHDDGRVSAPTAQDGPPPQPAGHGLVVQSPDVAQAPPDPNSDDWFADLESELTGAPAAATSGLSTAEASDDGTWAVELPVQMDSPTTYTVSTPSAESVHLESAPEEPADATTAVPEVSKADEGIPPEAAPDTVPSLLVSDADTFDPELYGPPATDVVTPVLLEEDAFDPEIQTPESTDAAAEDLDADTPAGDAETEPVPPDSEGGTAVQPAHVYVRPHQFRLSRAKAAWIAGCLVLVLVLAAQLAWAKRVALFRNPATRPWVTYVCGNIPCRLPPIKDTAKLALLSRDVRPDPNAHGALMITATVRNDASFSQPWPVVVVELTDIDNHPVAMRRFRPAEYMPNPARRAAGIAPGETAAIAFEVADPGKKASGFQFSFE